MARIVTCEFVESQDLKYYPEDSGFNLKSPRNLYYVDTGEGGKR